MFHSYDYLVLATGVTQSYFGHNEFAQYAPGLKTLVDAVAVRNKILQAFEQAEAEEDPSRHRDLLTFILVGARPDGRRDGRRSRRPCAEHPEVGIPADRSHHRSNHARRHGTEGSAHFLEGSLRSRKQAASKPGR